MLSLYIPLSGSTCFTFLLITVIGEVEINHYAPAPLQFILSVVTIGPLDLIPLLVIVVHVARFDALTGLDGLNHGEIRLMPSLLHFFTLNHTIDLFSTSTIITTNRINQSTNETIFLN